MFRFSRVVAIAVVVAAVSVVTTWLLAAPNEAATEPRIAEPQDVAGEEEARTAASDFDEEWARRRAEDLAAEKAIRDRALAPAKALPPESDPEDAPAPVRLPDAVIRAKASPAVGPDGRRRLRAFEWEAPADDPGEVRTISWQEHDEEILTAFLRIAIAEADGAPQDSVGIWQVSSNIRRRSCDRAAVRRITECDDEGGETLLSVMRRTQPHILGYVPLRNARAAWVRNIGIDCEPPEEWPYGENRWDARYGRSCTYTVELGRYLLQDKLPPPRPGARLEWLPGRPIAWGGRCESGRGACDDHVACARKVGGRSLVRVETETHNAFWKVASSPAEVDAICARLASNRVAP